MTGAHLAGSLSQLRLHQEQSVGRKSKRLWLWHAYPLFWEDGCEAKNHPGKREFLVFGKAKSVIMHDKLMFHRGQQTHSSRPRPPSFMMVFNQRQWQRCACPVPRTAIYATGNTKSRGLFECDCQSVCARWALRLFCITGHLHQNCSKREFSVADSMGRDVSFLHAPSSGESGPLNCSH